MINFSKLYDFLINSNARIQRLFLGGRSTLPIHVSIELNFACNLKCAMCYHINDLYRKEFLSYDDIKKMLPKFPKKMLLSFTGGEPFLNKDIFKILEYAKNFYNFTVTTNGILLTPETTDFLLGLSSKGLFSKGLFEIGVSFQGAPQAYKDIAGDDKLYYKIIENLKYLAAEKKRRNLKYPLVDLRLTVQKDNIDYLLDAYNTGRNLGVTHCNFAIMDTWKIYNRQSKDYDEIKCKIPEPIEGIDAAKLEETLYKLKEQQKKWQAPTVRFTPSGISVKEFADYYRNSQDLKHYDCSALWSNVLISPGAEVVICRDMVLGNILKNGATLSDIINSKDAVKLRKEITKIGLLPMCKGCCALEQR